MRWIACRGKKHIIYSKRHLRYSVRKSIHLKALIQIYSIFLELGIRIILMPVCTLHKPCELFNFTPLFSLVRWMLLFGRKDGTGQGCEPRGRICFNSMWVQVRVVGAEWLGKQVLRGHVPAGSSGHFLSPACVSSLASPPTAFLRSSNLLNWVQGCGQQNKKCFIYFLTGF